MRLVFQKGTANAWGISVLVVTEEHQDQCAQSAGNLRRILRNEVREVA